MSKITLDENFYIESDSFNVTLFFRREKEVLKKNKETGIEELKAITEKNEWYYPNLKGALRKYLDESLKESESVQEVLCKIEEVYKLIKTLKC